MGFSTIMFTVRIQNFLIQIASPENIEGLFEGLFVDQNLLRELFCLPAKNWPLYLRNRAIFAFKRTTSSYPAMLGR